MDIVHPEDRKIAIQVFQLAPDDPEWIDPFRIIFSDGTTKWIRCRAFKIIGEDGNVSKIIGFAKDVTRKVCGKIENQSSSLQGTESFGSELCSAI
ncbi:hypothetical protein LPTSP3_g15710 [Leptospira kobayashii]|uniref:PAC domain-containing protein n=1 Tax=Leptospira kobayashii TaxID=1917830 RepID=A0ABM7UIQ7_9LEPT|nr:hypothetical protein LPTSP3_g15710 [Leptospira kobayashii]